MVWAKGEDLAKPVRPVGFRAADAHFVGPLGRRPATAFATLRVDRLAVRETELTEPNLILL